jgi:hypothetical protein
VGRTFLPIVNRGDALFHIARVKPLAAAEPTPLLDEDEIV